MIALALILGAALFAGTILSKELQGGFASMEQRLGADIMVVPYAAVTKKSFDDQFLLGNTGYFYMPGEAPEKIAQMEGVSAVCSQYYVTAAENENVENSGGENDTVSTGVQESGDPLSDGSTESTENEAASHAVHLVGFEPENDFVITPWIAAGDRDTVEEGEMIAGSELGAKPGDTFSFFGITLTTAAVLDETGTDIDKSAFIDMNTARKLAEASGDEAVMRNAQADDGHAVSVVLVDVADGYDIESVLNDINIHIKKVRAIQTKQMVSGAGTSMRGAAGMAAALTGLIWAVGMAVMAAAFLMMTGERKKEFALLRIAGASRKKISGIVLTEGAILVSIGSAAGIGIGFVLALTCTGALAKAMSMPLLLPPGGGMALSALLAFALSLIAGLAGAAVAAHRISSQDTGLILRSGE